MSAFFFIATECRTADRCRFGLMRCYDSCKRFTMVRGDKGQGVKRKSPSESRTKEKANKEISNPIVRSNMGMLLAHQVLSRRIW